MDAPLPVPKSIQAFRDQRAPCNPKADPVPFSPPVSGLVRAQAEGLAQFESLGGLEVLGGALQSPQAPLRARAAFLLHSLLREHPHLKGEYPTPRPFRTPIRHPSLSTIPSQILHPPIPLGSPVDPLL